MPQKLKNTNFKSNARALSVLFYYFSIRACALRERARICRAPATSAQIVYICYRYIGTEGYGRIFSKYMYKEEFIYIHIQMYMSIDIDARVAHELKQTRSLRAYARGKCVLTYAVKTVRTKLIQPIHHQTDRFR